MSCETRHHLQFLAQFFAEQTGQPLPADFFAAALNRTQHVPLERNDIVDRIVTKLKEAYEAAQQNWRMRPRRIGATSCTTVTDDLFHRWAYAVMLGHEYLQRTVAARALMNTDDLAKGSSTSAAQPNRTWIEPGSPEELFNPDLDQREWCRWVLNLDETSQRYIAERMNQTFRQHAHRPDDLTAFPDNALLTAMSQVPPVPIDPGKAYLAMCTQCAQGQILPPTPAEMENLMASKFVDSNTALAVFGGTSVERAALLISSSLRRWSNIQAAVREGRKVSGGQPLARLANFVVLGPPGTGKTTMMRELAIGMPWRLPDGTVGCGLPFMEINATGATDAAEIIGRATLDQQGITMVVPPVVALAAVGGVILVNEAYNRQLFEGLHSMMEGVDPSGNRRATLQHAGGTARVAISPGTVFAVTANPTPNQPLAYAAFFDRASVLYLPAPDPTEQRQLFLRVALGTSVGSLLDLIPTDSQLRGEIQHYARQQRIPDTHLGFLDLPPSLQAKVLHAVDKRYGPQVMNLMQTVTAVNANLAEEIGPDAYIGARTVVSWVRNLINNEGHVVEGTLEGLLAGFGMPEDQVKTMLAAHRTVFGVLGGS
jgi:hypothetical protein